MSYRAAFMIFWPLALFFLAGFSLRYEDDDQLDVEEVSTGGEIAEHMTSQATSDEQHKSSNKAVYLTDFQKLALQQSRDIFTLTSAEAAMLGMTSEEFFAQYRERQVFNVASCKNASSCRRSVMILGGGPVGLFTGLELVHKGYEVTVMERAVYDGKWSQSKFFTRSQILVVQDAPNTYYSLSRIHTLLVQSNAADLWDELIEKSCGFLPPPRRGDMNCLPIAPGTTPPAMNSNFKLSISIRELQLLLQKGLVRAGGKVVFTHKFISFVDHRGHAFYSDKSRFGLVLSPAQKAMKDYHLENEWRACGVHRQDWMSLDDFKRCWKTIFHPNLPQMSKDIAKRMINMIQGDETNNNCKGAPPWARKPKHCNTTTTTPAITWGLCRISRENWYHIRMANEVKPDILICADGKSGDCRSIVGLGKETQKTKNLDDVGHKKHKEGPRSASTDNAWAMLFQVGSNDPGMANLLQLASNGSLQKLTARTGAPLPQNEQDDSQLWPPVQHRFRAFPSRYYPGTQEDFYFAAAITKNEWDMYRRLCDEMVGVDKCQGYFGWPRSATKQIDFVDPCKEVKECGNETLAKECDVIRGTMQGILHDVMEWTNVPLNPGYRGTILQNARFSAFPIFFLKAEKFAKDVTVGGQSTGVFAFAVGDAAMDVHFFSGSGVNIGIKAGTLLADLLGAATTSPFFEPGTLPTAGYYEDKFFTEAQAFAASFPRLNAVANADQNSFATYYQNNPHAAFTWRSLPALVNVYHNILAFYFVHSHMDASYNVLHAATYAHPACPDPNNPPCAACPGPGCTNPNCPGPRCRAHPACPQHSCFVCPGANKGTCPRGPGQAVCLEPVNNTAIQMTTNQRRIIDNIKDWGSDVHNPGSIWDAHRDTLCVLREAYR